MRKNHSVLWLALAVVPAALVLGGCVGRPHQPFRVSDPFPKECHHGDKHEAKRYDTWERESGRKHIDFSRLDKDEQGEYWKWRHSR